MYIVVTETSDLLSLSISLLGVPQVCLAGKPVELKPRKALALLAYLACTEVDQSRDTLVALLWPESDQTHARAALRSVLWALNRALGKPRLEVTSERIALNTRELVLDVSRFEALVAQVRAHASEHREDVPCTACAATLAEAVDLYRGEFLTGFSLGDCPEFETWQRLQAESLSVAYTQVLTDLVRAAVAAGDFARATEYLQRQLARDPLDEMAHYQLMRIHARVGQRSSALRQYEICRDMLWAELGIEPGEAVQELYRALRDGAAGSMPAGPSPPIASPAPFVRLPALITSLVGREAELEAIAQRVERAECRLLTITGPGGVGKTHLATAIAHQISQDQRGSFADGIAFVALDALQDADELLSALASAIGFSFQTHGDQAQQLLAFLRDKHMLLLLDNFESVLEGVPLIAAVLRHTTSIRMLVTSRERLQLDGEWVYEIRNLEVPDLAGPVEAVASCASVRMFVQEAGRHLAGFQAYHHLPDIARICVLVEGFPLALKLAAAWVRVIDCGEIAAELEASLDFLAASARDVPERHTSLRATFDYTWRRLSDEERRAFRCLSVFRGGFSREASVAIADVSLQVLSGLLDKSLLYRRNTRSYGMLEVLRYYAEEQLQAAGEVGVVRDRHSRYFAEWVGAQDGRLGGAGRLSALAEIGQEIENVRWAWDWALTQKQHINIKAMMAGLFAFYDDRCRFKEGAVAFNTLMDWHSGGDSVPELQAWALAYHGWFVFHLGEAVEGEAQLVRALEIFRAWDLVIGITFCLDRLGAIALHRSDYPAVEAHCREALTLAYRLELDSEAANSLFALSWVSMHRGEYAEARRRGEEALVLAQAAGLAKLEADGLRQLGNVSFVSGAYREAETAYRRALDRYRHLDYRWGEAMTLNNLGLVTGKLGDAPREAYERALAYGEQALQIYREVGDRQRAGQALNNLGLTNSRLGRYMTSLAYYGEALEISWALGDRHGTAAAVSNKGLVLVDLGDYEGALPLFEEALALYRETSARGDEASVLGYCGQVFYGLEDHSRAYDAYRHGLTIAEEIGRTFTDLLIGLGHVTLAQQQLDEAACAYQQAVTRLEAQGRAVEALEPRAGLAGVALAQGDLEDAYRQVLAILTLLTPDCLYGTMLQPFLVYLTCVEVLRAIGDARSASVLGSASALLLARADQITDQEMRRSYLERVPVHRALLDLAMIGVDISHRRYSQK